MSEDLLVCRSCRDWVAGEVTEEGRLNSPTDRGYVRCDICDGKIFPRQQYAYMERSSDE